MKSDAPRMRQIGRRALAVLVVVVLALAGAACRPGTVALTPEPSSPARAVADQPLLQATPDVAGTPSPSIEPTDDGAFAAPALASEGRRLDPAALLPMPREGLAIEGDQGIVLVTLDGTVLGHLPGYEFDEDHVAAYGSRGPLRLKGPDGSVVLDPLARALTAPGTPPTAAPGQLDGENCWVVEQAGEDTYLSCHNRNGAIPPSEDDVDRIDLLGGDGRQTALVHAAAEWGGGHWRDAALSPDGQWLLLQWSGECESPSAMLAPAAGGDPVPIAAEGFFAAPESYAMGWTADGRAVVMLLEGLCGAAAAEPGVYVLRPGEAPALVYPVVSRDTRLWRPLP